MNFLKIFLSFYGRRRSFIYIFELEEEGAFCYFSGREINFLTFFYNKKKMWFLRFCTLPLYFTCFLKWQFTSNDFISKLLLYFLYLFSNQAQAYFVLISSQTWAELTQFTLMIKLGSAWLVYKILLLIYCDFLMCCPSPLVK